MSDIMETETEPLKVEDLDRSLEAAAGVVEELGDVPHFALRRAYSLQHANPRQRYPHGHADISPGPPVCRTNTWTQERLQCVLQRNARQPLITDILAAGIVMAVTLSIAWALL
jgi:hypothetical protein